MAAAGRSGWGGGGLAPLIPPRSATEFPCLTRLLQYKHIILYCCFGFISQKTGSFTTKSKNSIRLAAFGDSNRLISSIFSDHCLQCVKIVIKSNKQNT